ncbi:MAG: lipocalin family protein [Methanotrichaceae archaeon]
MKPNKDRYGLIIALFLASCLAIMIIFTAMADDVLTPSAKNSIPLAINGSGNASTVFDFPADHLLHQPSPVVANTSDFIEWLYWTGTLRDVKTGNLYGFQYTLFHQNLMPGIIGYVNHVAISDVFNSQHPRNRYFLLPNQTEITNGTDARKGSYWRYKDSQTTLTYWKALDAWNIISQGNVSSDGGHGHNISMNLTLKNDKYGYFLEWPNGTGSMGACASIDPKSMVGKSYYYSHPAMNTTGTLSIDGREVEVRGDSWFDHQWGGYNKCYPAWDWFSMRLDNGSFLMLFNFKDDAHNDLPDQRSLTYVDPKGNIKWWYGKGAGNLTSTRLWTSDLFGFTYPLEWIISTPMGNYAAEPYFDEQIMNTANGEPKYWEGIMHIREENHAGEQIGIGYMELAGYAPIFS